MSKPENEDRLMRALAALPPRDAPDAVGHRVKRRALERLAIEHATLGRSWLGKATFLWSRVIMPAALASIVGAYLSWAYALAAALYR